MATQALMGFLVKATSQDSAVQAAIEIIKTKLKGKNFFDWYEQNDAVAVKTDYPPAFYETLEDLIKRGVFNPEANADIPQHVFDAICPDGLPAPVTEQSEKDQEDVILYQTLKQQQVSTESVLDLRGPTYKYQIKEKAFRLAAPRGKLFSQKMAKATEDKYREHVRALRVMLNEKSDTEMIGERAKMKMQYPMGAGVFKGPGKHLFDWEGNEVDSWLELAEIENDNLLVATGPNVEQVWIVPVCLIKNPGTPITRRARQ